MKIKSLRNVQIGKVRYKRSVDFPSLPIVSPLKGWIGSRVLRRAEVKEWLEENCEGRYYLCYDVKFERKQDALLFYIRFA